jgi:hypothetical protein
MGTPVPLLGKTRGSGMRPAAARGSGFWVQGAGFCSGFTGSRGLTFRDTPPKNNSHGGSQ